MLFFGTDFWPQFWTVIGSGAALTVVLSLIIATVPTRRRPHRRQPIAVVPRQRADAHERLVGAGR